MKLFNKALFVIAGTSVLTLTSCIEETFPENDTATVEQIGASASALESSVRGIPSQMCQGYLVYGDQVHETDMAYPLLMIAMTEMLGDIYPEGDDSGYDWYRNYNTFSRPYGTTSYFSFLPWFTLYKFIKTDNDVISAVDMDDESVGDDIKGLAGIAYAARAFNYYLLTVLFQPIENIYTDCSKVKDLTVPKVTEDTDRETAKSNRRLTVAEMKEFIFSDLDIAEKALKNYTPESKLYPNLAVVYGIKAKAYLWFEDYANAAKYARMAIEESGASPVTEAQWDDPTTGFCVANQAWMWYIHYDAENMGNLCNFTGWMSGEAEWSYSSYTRPSIDKSLYDKMNSTDFRHHTFLNPDRSYYDYKTCRDQKWLDEMPNYLSLKFRCKDGDFETYTVGGVVDVPVMRVEEMYFIEAEATAMAKNDVSAGVNLLNSFMQTYRDPKYSCKARTLRDFQIENLTQMRIEFWGEGNAFPSAKRIKPNIVQNYEGSNAPDNTFRINCEGIKPNWNLVIPQSETQTNQILEETNNPDPTQTVVGPTPIGTFAPAKH